jgi:pimeloyl-ACP methyl ester carboxylesterase
MARRLTLVLTVFAALAAQACTASERTVRLPDGRGLFIRCEGQGSPTVLFEAGYLATSGEWSKVQGKVAERTRACAYDRAGYGRSDPGPLPRDGAAVARDLDAGLRAAGISGPIVLVAHSAGGLYARLFADLRPKEVAGMVLVDPSAEHQVRRFEEVFGPQGPDALRARAGRCLEAAEAGALPSSEPTLAACAPKARAGQSEAAHAADVAQAIRASRWRTAASELDTLWAATSDEIDRGRPAYGAMPLIVLTADGGYSSLPPQAAAAGLGLWRQLHREIAARSSRGQERLVAGSSHMIMLDRPDAVTDAVFEVLDAVKGARTGPSQ